MSFYRKLTKSQKNLIKETRADLSQVRYVMMAREGLRWMIDKMGDDLPQEKIELQDTLKRAERVLWIQIAIARKKVYLKPRKCQTLTESYNALFDDLLSMWNRLLDLEPTAEMRKYLTRFHISDSNGRFASSLVTWNRVLRTLRKKGDTNECME